MYTINYDGGAPLVNVGQNGNLFTTTGTLTREAFGGCLRNVKIAGEPVEEGFPDLAGEFSVMRCSYFCDKGDVKEFVLVPYDLQELAYEELAGKLEYVAMMAGVEV